jgi:hypothetical protein
VFSAHALLFRESVKVIMRTHESFSIFERSLTERIHLLAINYTT